MDVATRSLQRSKTLNDAELNRHTEVRENMEPKIKEVRETVKGLQNSIAK